MKSTKQQHINELIVTTTDTIDSQLLVDLLTVNNNDQTAQLNVLKSIQLDSACQYEPQYTN